MEYIGIIVCHERIVVGKEMAIGYKKKGKRDIKENRNCILL